jgi:predicted nucleic acid-binding protein
MNSVSPVAYVDSNVFIYGLEGGDDVAVPATQFFLAMRQKPGALATSELTLAEVLGPSRGKPRSPLLRRAYIDLLVWRRFIRLDPISRDILYETAELRKITPLKLPDAIHLATAVAARCPFFVSRDRDFRKMPEWMEWVLPTADGLDRVARAAG